MSLFSHKFLQDFRMTTPQISQLVQRWLFALLLGICACGVSMANAAAPTISEVTGIPYGTSINGVTYGGGKYVAMTSSGRVYTSTDAESWTYSSTVSITSPRLTYFNSLYVVAGSAGKIYTSPDAVTWTARTSGTAQNFYDLKAIGGNVYAVGDSSTVVSSSDGSTWSAITLGVGNASDDLMTITSGNGLIVISARPSSGNSTYFRSSTGASNSWSASTGGDNTTNGAYFLNDRFYAFYAGTRVETSTDAITWTNITSTSVTRPDSSTTVLGSPNQMFRGYHDGTSYFLFGSGGTYGYGTIIRSTNGSTYTMVAPTASIVGQGAAVLNGKHIQWGNEGLAVSDDGLTYHFVTGSYNGIATNGAGSFSLVGAQGSNPSAVSNTSTNWPTLGALATRTGTKSFNDVVWDGSQYVAVGENVIATSADGSSWTNAGSHTGNVYQSVLYQGGNYLVSGYDGTTYEWKFWRGSNLSSLSVVDTLASWFFRIKYENNIYFALGYDGNTSLGVVYTSPDGVTWTDNTPTLTGGIAYYTDAVWTGSKYVITGTTYVSSIAGFFSTTTTTPTNPASYTAKVTITGAPGGSQIAADWSQGAFRYINGHIVGVLNDVSDNSYPAYLLDSDDEGATWTATALDGSGSYNGSLVDGNSVKFVSSSGMLANIEFAVNNTPTVTTAAASSITKTTASVGGDVTSDAGSAVTERGVVYALTTADPTPTYAEVNGTTVFKSTTSGTTGAYSIGLTGLTAGSQYSVAAYALNANGTGAGSTETFTTTALNTNADLSALSLSAGTLSPGFAAGTISYTASVGNATSSITVTPTSSDSAATITVNGVSVTSGAASGAIALAVGANTVTVVVTAENGSSTKTYTVTVTRAASSNADLSGLTTSSGSLSPGFAAGTTSYSVSVNNATSSITVTPTTAVNTATVTVNGVTVSSGAASGAIALNVGTNTVNVVVTAQDGTTTKTYTLNVTRSVSTNADLSGLTPSSGSLSPGFASGTTSYTASVSNATSSITVTPTTADSASTVTVNGVSVTSGAASGAIALNVGANTVTVVVTAEDGTTTKTYTVTVTRALSSNADLSGLTPSSGSLSPGFAAGTTSYTASVSNATSSITLTPTTADSTATVTVNGVAVTSGAASGAIALTVGANTVTVLVTAADGTTTKSYTVTVTRAASSNADLAGLTPSSGSLSPAFAAGTTSYTASVSNATSSITITPTVADSTATVTVNGAAVSSGAASGAIALTVGANTVTVVVTAEDGTTTNTYTVTVTRAASSNADLAGLTPSSGSLSPGFATGTTSYTVSVNNATSSITVTPTAADSTATITVNSVTVSSGTASGAIALNVGANTVTVVVTAEDGTTTKTYTVTVTRALSSNADLSGLTPSSGSLSPGFASGTTSYTASVSNATSSITVTPTTADSASTVTVNGVSVTSGAASGAIALNVGANTVTVVVTAEDGTTTKTYTVTVTRALSSNADLSGLTPSSGSLSPGFAAGTTSYTVSVSNATSSITITPTTADSTATVTVNGVAVVSGNASSPIALSVGANTITVVITAADSTTKTYTIIVTNVNEAPVISGTPASSVTQDVAYSFTPSASDPYTGSVLTFSISNKPGWATFDTATGALTGTPGNSDVGSHSGIVISVSDGALSTALPTFSITVVNVNDAPVIGGTPPTTATQDVLYSFVPTATDIDVGTTLTFSISNKPAWATFNTATGALTGTPTNSDIGSYSNIVISVSDGAVTTALTAFSISVGNTNDAPTISGTPATTATQGIAYNFVPVAADVDVGTTLVFSISNKPTWATFDTATGALAGTPANGDVGSHSGIVISVSDGALSATLPAFNITVANVNDAPTITGTPPTTATQDLLYSFVPTAADVDVGTTLTFSISNKPAWATFNTVTGALTGTPTNNDIGSYSNIVISVSDGVATTALTAFSITVVNSNDAPTIGGTPATTATQDIAYSFVPVAADVDVGTTLLFSISNKPSWANFSTTTGALTGTPANGDVGSYSGIVISVSDGTLSAALPAFSITVANVNDAPTISGSPLTKVTAGVLYSFTPVAADIDVGTTLTFSISNKPTWATFNPATGQLSGTPARTDVGSTNGIVIQVSDGTASAALAAFNLEVLNSNTAPVARDSLATLREDEPAAITLETSDAEGDQLKIAITKQPAHGSLIAEGAGYRYAPATDYHGSDSFSFVASDAEFSSATATVSLTITPVNDNPLVVADSFSVARLDTDRYTLNVLSNDTDVDGDRLTIDGATASTGTVTFSSAGLIYQAPTGYLGQVDLRYSVSDGQQGRASAEVKLQITGTAGGNLPVITLPADVEMNATALYTKVDLGVATAVDRNGLTLPVSLVDGQTFFAPGEHIAYWQATDSQGNKATKGQRVSVKPLISLSKDAVVTEGSDVTVQVLLNGPAPAYPVEVPYTVAGSANGNDHSLTAGVVVITSGTTGVIQFSVFEDAQTEGTENIQIALDPTLNLGSQSAMQVSIREDNIAPTVQLVASQNDETRLTVAKNQGVVTVKATVADQNPQDVLSLQWNTAGLSGADIDGDQLEFDPSTQTPGVYMVAMTATDNGAPALTTTDQMYIVIVDALPALTTADTDGDLIPDSEEGFADADGDGIADYLDVIADCNVVPEEGKQQVSFLAEGSPGVCLRRGQDSVLSQSGGLQLLPTEVETDAAAANIGGIFDFIAYGLPVPGQTYQLVLPQRLPVPANAVYRKYNVVTGWVDFVSDSRNFVSSSAGERGFCPPPGDTRWSAGLTEGHWCVQVSVQDGGPNDADGIANGTIVDPSGVSIRNNGNRLPVAKPDAVTTRIGIAVEVKVLANDSDADGDTLKVSQVSAQFGQIEVLADQQLRYVPAPQFSGTDRVTYSVTDGKGGTGSSELTVTVLPSNGPVAVNDVASTDDKTAVTIAVLANDSDPDGDVLTVLSATAQQGTVTIQSDKSLRYQPKAGFEGTDTVRYVIADSQGMQAQGQVVITVKAYKDVIVNNKSSGGALGLLWFGLFIVAAWRRGVITLMLLMCLPAAAQASDWYGFVEAGQAKADRSAADIRAQLSGGTLLDLEQKDSAFGLGAGYQITDTLAVEPSYWDFGEASADISQSSLTPASYHDLIKQVSPALGEAIGAGGRFTVWQQQKWQLDVGAGVLNWQSEISSTMGGTVLNSKFDGTDLYYAVSAGYQLTNDLSLSARWQRTQLKDNDVDLLTLRMSYRF